MRDQRRVDNPLGLAGRRAGPVGSDAVPSLANCIEDDRKMDRVNGRLG